MYLYSVGLHRQVKFGSGVSAQIFVYEGVFLKDKTTITTKKNHAVFCRDNVLVHNQ